MFQFQTPVYAYMQDYNHVGRYALKPLVVAQLVLDGTVYMSLTSD